MGRIKIRDALIISGLAYILYFTHCLPNSYNKYIKKKDTTTQLFGTFDYPKFELKECPNTNILTYSSTQSKITEKKIKELGDILKYEKFIESISENSDKFLNHLDDYFANLNFDAETLDSIAMNQAIFEYEMDPIRREYVSNIKGLEKFKKSILETSSALLTLQIDFDNFIAEIKESLFNMREEMSKSSQEETVYGDVFERAKILFKKITGKEFPNKINVSIEDISEPEVGGYYNAFLRKIAVEDASYTMVLSKLMHELGHSISLHNEEEINKSFFIQRNSITREVSVMEEACAYAFRNVAEAFEENQDLMNKMITLRLIYDKELIQEFFDGEREPHREAVAIADATLTCFQNPVKAFEYLRKTRYEDINSEILQEIDKNKRIYLMEKEGQELVQISINRCEALLKRCKNIYNKYHYNADEKRKRKFDEKRDELLKKGSRR